MRGYTPEYSPQNGTPFWGTTDDTPDPWFRIPDSGYFGV